MDSMDFLKLRLYGPRFETGSIPLDYLPGAPCPRGK